MPAPEMHTGLLTRRVAFDAPAPGDDGHGGIVTGWTGTEAEIQAWAHFRHLRGSETVIAARLAGRQPIVVTIRATVAARAIGADWRMRDLDAGDWASGDVWTGPVYNLRQAPVPGQSRQWLELLVEGGVPT